MRPPYLGELWSLDSDLDPIQPKTENLWENTSKYDEFELAVLRLIEQLGSNKLRQYGVQLEEISFNSFKCICSKFQELYLVSTIWMKFKA